DHKAEVTAAAGPIAGLAYAPIADAGDSLPFAPDHNVVTSLNYLLPLPSEIGAVEFGATYVYVGKQRATATSSSPYAILDNYSLLNLNLNWTGIFNLPLDFSVFGTNILDKHYVTYISGTYNALGFDSRQLGQPRMFGGRLRYTFGGG
ncbi:MAG TPA: TonB-dependent receptor, partial [Solimonas sp.]